MTRPETVRPVLARAGIVSGFAPDVVDALIDRMWLKDIARGDVIYTEGEPGDGLYIVVSGKVKVGRRSADGREQLSAIMGPSDMFGVLSTFDPGPRTATATAITDVCLATTDRDVVRDWMRSNRDISARMLQVLARRLRRTDDHLADLIFTDVPGRVAKQLLEFASRFGVDEGETVAVNHELTQEEIAQLIGSSRETTNKALADFANRGWIELSGKTVRIKDAERLRRRAR